MSNKKTGKVLAIQLGMEETQLVLLDNGVEILHTVSLSTPVGAVDDGVIVDPDAIRAMLKQALKDPVFNRVRKAAFTLCTSQVIAETAITPEMAESKLGKVIRANVDMYSGLVYKMMDIPPDLFTPLFAIARVVGWCAHRFEETFNPNARIIRPAYKAVTPSQSFIPMDER